MNYKIPEDIKAKIPDAFYLGLGGECVSIFGTNALSHTEDGFELDYYTSTYGWYKAIKITCAKLNLGWLYEYYESLDWEDSDLFNDEVAGEVKLRITDSKYLNAYYSYLIDMEMKKEHDR